MSRQHVKIFLVNGPKGSKFSWKKSSFGIFKLFLKVTERVGIVADADDDVDVDELQPLTLGQNNGAKRQKYGSLANKDSTTTPSTHLITHKVLETITIRTREPNLIHNTQ